MTDDFFDGEWEFVEEESDGEGSIEYVGYDPTSENEATAKPSEDPIATPADKEPPTSTQSPSSPESYQRGTFVFDSDDTDLLQKMEIRGNNGVTEAPHDVETKYLLTGPTYTTPTDIIQLDNPDLYSEVTENSIQYNVTKIAEYVATLHKQGPQPNIVVSVHTHPSGNTHPSAVDRTDPTALKEELSRHLSDFEFLQGIHGLQDRSIPDSTELREIQESEGHFWWYGENRCHELAIYDEQFKPTNEVVVE